MSQSDIGHRTGKVPDNKLYFHILDAEHRCPINSQNALRLCLGSSVYSLVLRLVCGEDRIWITPVDNELTMFKLIYSTLTLLLSHCESQSGSGLLHAVSLPVCRLSVCQSASLQSNVSVKKNFFYTLIFSLESKPQNTPRGMSQHEVNFLTSGD